MVERLSIGAMNVESALKYFRRTHKKAVITGGDRSDIILAALETPTECLILTGGIHPDHTIITRAKGLGVPVLLVESDTLTTVDKVEILFGHLDFRSESKIEKAYEIVNDHIDIKRLSELIGISISPSKQYGK
jgi:BioD-like phosphotransacetylase family protein